MKLIRSRLLLFVLVIFAMALFTSKRLNKHSESYAKNGPVSTSYNQVSNVSEVNADRITVVTAYFDLGTFYKGSRGQKFSKQLYFRWTGVFQFMTNPLVVYTDTPDFYELMHELRKGQEANTKILLINKNSSWAFQNELRVKEIISKPGYPKHHPNTVVSGYSCSQHAKYDVIERVSKANFFGTKFISWVDIGYFRDRKSERNFELVKLQDLNESCVMMNQVYSVKMSKTPKDIFLKNLVWVGGGLIVGERKTMIHFAKLFRRAVDFYLLKGLVNTDQQVLYAIYSKTGRKDIKPEVDIQLYRSLGDWFGLGYRMLKEDNQDNSYLNQNLSRLTDHELVSSSRPVKEVEP